MVTILFISRGRPKETIMQNFADRVFGNDPVLLVLAESLSPMRD